MANVGGADRLIRAILAIILILMPFLPFSDSLLSGLGMLKYAVTAVGLVLLATAAIGYCPLYGILGLNVCPVERR